MWALDLSYDLIVFIAQTRPVTPSQPAPLLTCGSPTRLTVESVIRPLAHSLQSEVSNFIECRM